MATKSWTRCLESPQPAEVGGVLKRPYGRPSVDAPDARIQSSSFGVRPRKDARTGRKMAELNQAARLRDFNNASFGGRTSLASFNACKRRIKYQPTSICHHLRPKRAELESE
jgi:hypothetical protein